MKKLEDVLYDKMSKEYDDFIDRVKGMTDKDKIIESSYEVVLKQDILFCFEGDSILNDKQCAALLKMNCPLDELYNGWLESDASHMDVLRDCITDIANDAVRIMNCCSKDIER